MTRLILAAAALTVLSLPAAAQRLDDRVREVRRTGDSVKCRLNANRDMQIETEAKGEPARGFLLQRPVESEPGLSVKLGFSFEPQKGGRFGVGARFFAFNTMDLRQTPAPPPVSARLLLDGEDSGVTLDIHWEGGIHNRDLFIDVPDALSAEVAERMLRTRWIDVELTDPDKRVRVYRFDGLRIADAAEILSLIKFSCDGVRAD